MIKITNNMQQFKLANKMVMDSAMGRMANDTLLVSKIRVPLKDGDLQKSGSVEKVAIGKYKVVYDEDYAGYQERGRRLDGSRVVKNYTTPGTGKDFLKSAGVIIGKDSLNYLKQAAMLIKL